MPWHWEGDFHQRGGQQVLRRRAGGALQPAGAACLHGRCRRRLGARRLYRQAQFDRRTDAPQPHLRPGQGDEPSLAARPQHLRVCVYFCDPHSLWQRGTCENTNGLLRQYLPKGTDLCIYSQEELDSVADSLSTRPRATHGFSTPLAVFSHLLTMAQQAPSSLQ
jgi:IS30 family transposase